MGLLRLTLEIFKLPFIIHRVYEAYKVCMAKSVLKSITQLDFKAYARVFISNDKD